MSTFKTNDGITVRGLQAQKAFIPGDLIAEVKLDPIISVPFRLGNDPWYAELAARLLAVADGKLLPAEDVTRFFAQDLFESLDGATTKYFNPKHLCGTSFSDSELPSPNNCPLLS
jgi:hypothetical protein